MTRIAKRVLAFRERQRPGKIMRPSTFEEIEREAASGGARDPGAVAGAAYWKTLAARYRGNPKVLLREVKDAERDYASGVAAWGEHDQGVIRRWIRWKDLQKAYEAQTGKPLYAWKGNPAELDHAMRELEAARKRYEQAKTQAAKRAAAEDVQFWGNKAAFLERAKGNPTKLELQRAARERAAAIRGARLNPGILDEIRHGDKVTILVPAGIGREGQEYAQRTGTAVMRGPHGWVLNLGGRFGTPAVASESNIVRVRKVGRSNPAPVGVHRGVQIFFEGISYNAPSLKLWGYSTDLALQRAIDRKLKKAGGLQEAVKRAQFGQNPARVARVETYQLRAMTGRPIRRATKVVFDDGREVRFMERMPKRKAIRQAIEEITRHPESFPARNPEGDAAELYRSFHGKEPHEVIELAVTAEQAGTYTVLGDLVELTIDSPSGNRVKLNFKDDGVKLASSGGGSQLYLFEGNQDLTECLAEFDIDTSKETLDLGDAIKVVYDAAKWQTDFKPQEWDHKFGEESGVCPRVFYRVHPPAKSKQQIFFAGGNYRVERPGIVD